ncbi:GLPGLI family protein [Faecalibacter rhinopitheci]|uniref:GLPGLI family protein n=1 Tax=Faecalibacter rhinopitheci TaxID=2779678 RepID=A0A8J7G513_9FLAO|nr:GLPGLI family protein [Faecalibacter rhinopitheci]MBF0596777.1 GLPGLI family protein [Faecalibacter rhinopitheci]
MKNILTLYLLFITSFVFAQTESIRATYTAEFIFDYEQSKDLFPKDLQPVFKSLIDKGIFLDFILESNNQLSVFRAESKINNAQDQSNMIVQELLTSEQNPLFKDFSKNEYYKQYDINVKTFLVKDQIPNLKWQLTKEKSTINGYNATKAIGEDIEGNEFVAWYSTDVKYKDGPHNFANLPGLILKTEIKTPFFTTIFTLKNLEILDKPLKITLPQKGKIVTFEEMRKEIGIINQ